MTTPFYECVQSDIALFAIQVYAVTRDNDTCRRWTALFFTWASLPGFLLLLPASVAVVHPAHFKRRMGKRRVDSLASDRDWYICTVLFLGRIVKTSRPL